VVSSATIHRFVIELSDIDDGVYETLDLRIARHPSEDQERLVVRVLARAMAHETGLEFGRGLSEVEDAALWKMTPTGEIETWIDVGAPSAQRLHRASKRAERVKVYTHKPESSLRREWSSRAVHRADTIEIVQLDPGLIRDLAADLSRTVTWYLTIQDRILSVSEGERNLQSEVVSSTLTALLAT